VTKPKSLLAIAAAVLGMLAALWVGMNVSGAAKPLELGDPGDFVRWAAPIAKGLTNLSMAVTVGTLVLAAWALPHGSARLSRALNIAGLSGMAWVLFGVSDIVLRFSSITNTPIDSSAKFSAGLWQFITEIPLGQALAISLIIASVASFGALMLSSLRSAAFLAGIALAAIVPIALTGHAAGQVNHGTAVNAIGMHLVAITVWLGGLVAVMFLRGKENDKNFDLVSRYSTLALWAFAITAISGVASAWISVVDFENLFTSYGLVVLGKVSVLVVLGAFGFVYRRGVVAKIKSGGSRLFAKLAVVELAFMGIAAGLGTTLSVTAPPADEAVGGTPTPAQILTGELLPPEMTGLSWFTAWKIDLLWLTICSALAVFYLFGVYRLRKRGDAWPIYRTASWLAGLGLLFYITNGAMNAYEHVLFSVHMIAHMMLSMAVPILLVPGAPVTLLSRASEKRHDDSRGLREWVLWAVHTPYARFFGNPIVAAAMFASSLIVFYFTPVFGWSTRDHLGHEWMIVHFLITGYLFVQSLIGADPGPKLASYPIRLMVLILTLTFHAFFGLALMQGESLLLSDWFGAMGRTWGMTPLEDQQIGGAIAWGIGELPSAVLTIIVSRQWFSADGREQRRADRASDRTGNQDIEDYNAMLAKLAGRKEER
jgi:cytochrome c oxidase assembly factor CtaG/putative copper export protein